MKKKSFITILLLFLIILFYGLFSLSFILKDPPIWPDEAIYADIVNNFIQQHRLGTDLWKGLVPGIENHAFLYPPLFFLILALDLKIFGFSVLNQRLLSVFFGLGFLILYYFFTRLFFKTKNWLLYLTPTFLLAIDINFLRGARISRPEIFVLFFGFVSLYLFFLNEKKNYSGRKRLVFPAASGFFSSLSFLCHYIGLIYFFSLISYLFFKKRLKLFSSFDFYVLSSFFLAPIFLWLLSIFPNFKILVNQFFLSLQVKNVTALWPLKALIFKSVPGILNFGYLSLMIIFLFFVPKKNTSSWFLIIISFIIWLFTIAGRLIWYFIFPIPLAYLTTIYFVDHPSTGKHVKKLTKSILLGLFTVNMAIQIKLFLSYPKNHYQYVHFTNQLSRIIPKDKTVFLSVVPDPYYGLKETNNYRLFEFPAIASTPERYLAVLNQTDYVIYNGLYEISFCGNLLPEYLEKNKRNVYLINDPFQYQTEVIELKPLAERVYP